MADVNETAGPRFEVRESGPGFSSTHIWPGDRVHESRGTICNEDSVFHTGPLAADERIEVTRGRLLVICLDQGDEDKSYDSEPNEVVTLKKGRRYRLVAVGLTQYHCVHGPEEDAETADEAPAPATAAPAASAAPRTPDTGGLGLPPENAPSSDPTPLGDIHSGA